MINDDWCNNPSLATCYLGRAYEGVARLEMNSLLPTWGIISISQATILNWFDMLTITIVQKYRGLAIF